MWSLFDTADTCRIRPLTRVVALGVWLLAVWAWGQSPLRVTIDGGSRVFDPQENCSFDVAVSPAEIGAGVAFDLSVSLAPVGGGDDLWRAETQRVDAPPEGDAHARFEAPLPDTEGVYELTIRATRTSRFASRFIAGAKKLAERTFQVLVFDPNREVGAPASWREEYAFNPASPRWRDRVQDWADWRRLPWIDSPTPTSLPGGARRDASGAYLELPPSPARGEAHWQAYSLANDRLGEARVVEVEWPADQPQQLTLALFDREPDGQLRALCEPVMIEATSHGDSAPTQRTRIVCWPQTPEPLLVVANPSSVAPARFGRIRLLAPEGRVEQAGDQRLVALDWSGAAAEESVGLASSDLNSRRLSVARLADRVQLAGANGAVIDAPLAELWTAPAEGTPDDLPPAGLTELLLKEFDRRGLRLIPALRFEGTLPGLEAQRQRADSGGGWQWVHEEGEAHTLVAYSPLHPRVREEMNHVARRAIELGAGHRSFAGLAIRLGDKTYARLPGNDWGYDPDTVDRFLTSLELQWPEGSPRDAASHAAAIREHALDSWQAWRRNQLLEFYNGVGQDLEAASTSGVGLLLLPEGAVHDPLAMQAAPPRLGEEASLGDLLTDFGLITSEEESVELPIAIPFGHTAQEPFAAHAAARRAAVGAREALTRAASKPNTSVSVFARSEPCTLINSARALRSPDGADLTLSASVVTGTLAAPLVRAVAMEDPSCLLESGAAAGGLLDESAAEVRRQLTLAPPSPVTPGAPDATSDVDARVLRDDTHGYVMLLNRSAWTAQASVTVKTNERSLATPLQGNAAAEWCEAGQHVLTAELPPYSVQMWSFSSSGVEAIGVRSQPHDTANQQLRTAVDDLLARDRTARRPYTETPNPSFESRVAQGSLIGWTHEPADEATELTAPESGSAQGDHALRLAAGQSVSCTAFRAPETGQLILQFQAQGEGLSPEAALRLDLETTDGAYRVHTVVTADQLQVSASPGVWRPIIFGVDDLPLGEERELILRFTLKGEGRVWLDDLRADALMLPIEAYAEQTRGQKLALVKLIHAAETALDEGRLAQCQELLDSYWLRFLAEYFPTLPEEPETPAGDLAVEAPPGESPTDPPTELPDDAEGNQPSMAERVKGWFWR